MLSKSKGQVLRVAAALHVLFHVADVDAGDEEQVMAQDDQGDEIQRKEQENQEESYEEEMEEEEQEERDELQENDGLDRPRQVSQDTQNKCHYKIRF